MKDILIALTLVLAAATSAYADAVYDDMTDVTKWTVGGKAKETANEKFRSHTVAKEMMDTWSFDNEKGLKYQCNNRDQQCAAIQCEYGKPWLLIADPANRGYKIRFWAMDYERKTRTPLTVESPDFEYDGTTYFTAPTVKVWLTLDLLKKMTFGDTIRIAYSFPISDRDDVDESPNDIFVHMESSDGPIDPGEMFGHCAETTNLKTD